MKWYLKVVLKQYADFEGRARRTEYWMFALFNFLAYFGVLIVSGLLNNLFGTEMFGGLIFLYVVFSFVPSLAVTVRRLHDVGKSGWFLFISLIPLIGAIWLFVLYVTEGDYRSNEYGNNPKEEGDFDAIDQIGME